MSRAWPERRVSHWRPTVQLIARCGCINNSRTSLDNCCCLTTADVFLWFHGLCCLIWVVTARITALGPSVWRSIEVWAGGNAFPSKLHVRPEKTQTSLCGSTGWSESLLSAWRYFGSVATNRVSRKYFYQTAQRSRLTWVFAGLTCKIAGYVPRLIFYFWYFKECICCH